MSRVRELIDELCPDGVPYRPLGEIATLVRGNGMPKTDLTEEGVGAIHYGQIYTHYGVWTDSTISFVLPSTAARLARVDPGDVIITNTSENLEDVGKAVAWVGDKQIVTGGHATVIKHHMNPKFLAYWFQTPDFFRQKKTLATGAKVIDVSAKSLMRVRVPVPSVGIQQEIVRILDAFTSLEAELEAELEARRVQHVHYRQVVLRNLSSPKRALSSLGNWYGGVTPSKGIREYWKDGSFPWIASMDVGRGNEVQSRQMVSQKAIDETSLRIISGPAVVVVVRSNILRRELPIGLLRSTATLNQDVRALVPCDDVDAEYVVQAMQAERDAIRAKCVRTDGSMAAVESKKLMAYRIPLPEVGVQKLIASKLRLFGSLIESIESGLPAEIAARRQQYEYYRDQLLTFKELSA